MLNHDELLLTVDETNRPVKPRTRKDVHSNGCWHRTTHIWIVNNRKQILCQRRSALKDSNPGKWECFFGGHLAPGQDYQSGAIQELKEEVGIAAVASDLMFVQVFKCIAAKEFQGIFLLNWNGHLNMLEVERDEIDSVKWLDVAVLKHLLESDKEAAWTQWGYQSKVVQIIASDALRATQPTRQ